MPKNKPKDILEHMDLEGALHGSVRIPKSRVVTSKDPMALRQAISEQYTAMVQKHPELEFGIQVDPKSDDILVHWKRISD
jgi:hypothetical protein